MKKKLLMVSMLFTLVTLAACGSGDISEVNMEHPVEIDAAQAQSDYQRCASCHGQNLEGGPYRQYMLEPLIGMSYEKVLTDIIEGPGSMPASMVTGDRARNLAAWIAEQ